MTQGGREQRDRDRRWPGALRPRTRPPGPGARRASGRVQIRLPVPEGVLDTIRYGSEHPGSVCEHWWRAVEDRTERWLLSQVPAGARALRIRLDERSLQVRVAFSAPTCVRG